MNPAIARRRHARTAATRNGQTGFQERQHARHEVNVGQSERQLSMIGGGVLAAYGLLRGSLPGLALAALGGALLWRGYSGHCEMYHLLGHSSAEDEAERGHRGPGSSSDRGKTASADMPL